MISAFVIALVIVIVALGFAFAGGIIVTKVFHIMLNGPIESSLLLMGVLISIALFQALGWWVWGRRK